MTFGFQCRSRLTCARSSSLAYVLIYSFVLSLWFKSSWSSFIILPFVSQTTGDFLWKEFIPTWYLVYHTTRNYLQLVLRPSASIISSPSLHQEHLHFLVARWGRRRPLLLLRHTLCQDRAYRFLYPNHRKHMAAIVYGQLRCNLWFPCLWRDYVWDPKPMGCQERRSAQWWLVMLSCEKRFETCRQILER